MAELSPVFLDSLTYPAKELRKNLKDIFTEGILTSTALACTEHSTPAMSVDIASGRALIESDEGNYGTYIIENDALVTKTIAASDPSNPRIDRVIAQMYDATDIGGADNKWALEVLTGTPAASPVAPALPSNALDLALVAVAAGATTILNADIIDQRTKAGSLLFMDLTNNVTKNGIVTFGSFPITPSSAPTTNYQVANKKYADDSVATLKTALKKNGMICFAPGFIINGSSATLVETAGTATKCYAAHLSALKTHWFDFPKIVVPSDYDGGSIDISVCFRSAAASKKHSLGIRVASVATGEAHNPDLAAAYQLYNEEVSDATAGNVKIKKVTVAQANHLMTVNEIWHCKFVVEDDAGADADAVLYDWILIEWNKA
ncbi:MAG: hypothetical protein LLG05_12280 [Porphyromonadaceae bacterium]|nr:hypothetical protein [Porphyromonadaceae bacterium]